MNLTAADVQEMRGLMTRIKTGSETIRNRFETFDDELPAMGSEIDEMRGHVTRLRLRSQPRSSGAFSLNRKALVSDECARHLGLLVILGAERNGRLKHLRGSVREELLYEAEKLMGVEEVRAALNSTDVPLPTNFGGEVVQLVSQYSKGRKWGTVYPAGFGSKTKLPRLKTSPAFEFIDVSAAIPEKRPQVEWVDFNPEKAGGIVRIPAEIDQDALINMGNFVADYSAREMARWEDTVFFKADGTATYKSMNGVLKTASNLGRKVTLGTGKTKPSDITLADLRAMRGQVDSAALLEAAYYFSPTMEAKLISFNSGRHSHPVYIQNGPKGATLDGFPVRWVEVLPPFEVTSRPSQLQCAFGDLQYFYMCIRPPGVIVTYSKDVFFATDELAIRILERFAVGLMADAALSTLELAAS